MIVGALASTAAPDEITPQVKAHMGGNHVMGFSSVSTAAGAGNRRG